MPSPRTRMRFSGRGGDSNKLDLGAIAGALLGASDIEIEARNTNDPSAGFSAKARRPVLDALLNKGRAGDRAADLIGSQELSRYTNALGLSSGKELATHQDKLQSAREERGFERDVQMEGKRSENRQKEELQKATIEILKKYNIQPTPENVARFDKQLKDAAFQAAESGMAADDAGNKARSTKAGADSAEDTNRQLGAEFSRPGLRDQVITGQQADTAESRLKGTRATQTNDVLLGDPSIMKDTLRGNATGITLGNMRDRQALNRGEVQLEAERNQLPFSKIQRMGDLILGDTAGMNVQVLEETQKSGLVQDPATGKYIMAPARPSRLVPLQQRRPVGRIPLSVPPTNPPASDPGLSNRFRINLSPEELAQYIREQQLAR